MPRKPRFFIPGIAVHIVQRGRSREPVFFDDADYRVYLARLRESAQRYGCEIHAYVLMTNHVHILATPSDSDGITRMMQYVGRRYVPYLNHTYGMSGSIWEGRYKASLVQEGQHLLTCMRYIELNPVRANMVDAPANYRWSSYHSNAQGESNAIISPHVSYLNLAASDPSRQCLYKQLFSVHVDKHSLSAIQAAWQTGTPWGNDYFREKVEARLGRKTGQARRGKPVKGL